MKINQLLQIYKLQGKNKRNKKREQNNQEIKRNNAYFRHQNVLEIFHLCILQIVQVVIMKDNKDKIVNINKRIFWLRSYLRHILSKD